MKAWMEPRLVIEVNDEIVKALGKWGDIDCLPGEMVNAVTEELLEVVHAVNHREPVEKIHHEIVQAIGVLVRLDHMVKEGGD